MDRTRNKRRARLLGPLFLASLMGLVSCGLIFNRADNMTKSLTAGPPTITESFAGDQQSAEVDTQVPIGPALRVKDAQGTPTPGIRVIFSVTEGGGRLEGTEQFTDAEGVARVGAWILGPTPGLNEIKGEVDGLAPVFFKANGLPDERGSFTKAAGDQQTRRVGEPLPVSPTVLIQDKEGRPLAGRPVTFTLLDGGTIVQTSVRTDADGRASAGIWTLASTVGVQRLRAETDGDLPPLEFTAQATTADAPNFVVETVLSNLESPWDIVFLPDGDMLFTLRGRGIYRLPKGQNTPIELARPTDLNPRTQSGMLGLAIDPNFATNRFVYSYQSSNRGGVMNNRVRKWRLSENKSSLTEVGDILSGVTWGSDGGHSGGRMIFGPDGYLYVGTGDTRSATVPQDLNALGGKILRITTTGAPAPGHPQANGRRPEIFAHGFRNIQGLAIRSDDRGGGLFACEHGPNQDDEVTRVTLGGNGGWDPNDGNGNYNGYSGAQMTDVRKFPQALPPTWKLSDSVGMSGCAFLEGSAWKAWEGYLAVGVLAGGQVHVLDIDRSGATLARPPVSTLSGNGRVRTVTVGPDSSLYIAIDANPAGRILRVRPLP